MKKLLSLFLVIAILCTVVSQTALPASAGGIPVTAETSGICGANLTWNYDELSLVDTQTEPMLQWSVLGKKRSLHISVQAKENLPPK